MQLEQLVDRKETTYLILASIIASIIWLALIIGSMGIVLIFLALGWLVLLFAHSAFISYIKGNAVKISENQYPELYQALQNCAEKIKLNEIPEAYLLNGNGIFNALATHFLMRNYIVLYSTVIDALEDKPEAINFYIGHELGHLKRHHIMKHMLLFPAIIMPLLGSAYARACEYTCDRHGLACCHSLQDAQDALCVLAAGHIRWRTINLDAFMQQTKHSGQFWMAFNELTQSHPWTSKRAMYLQAVAANSTAKFPTKNPFAVFFALFVPNFSQYRALNFFIVIYVIVVVCAVTIPAVKKSQEKALQQQQTSQQQQSGSRAPQGG